MPPPTTPDDPDERRARHLAYAQEIQRTCMGLFRATAEKAALQLVQNDQDPETPAQERPSGPVQDVIRLARIVNQTMAVEHRIATSDHARQPRTYKPATRTPAPRTPAPAPDRRRDLLREALYRATKTDPAPERTRRRRDIDAQIEHQLQADADDQTEAIELLQIIADDLEIQIDPRHLTDEILGMPPRIHTPDDHRCNLDPNHLVPEPYRPEPRKNL